MKEHIPIGEFSKMCGISVRSLRHYDSIDLLKPAFIDISNGYRFYSYAQFNTAESISLLRFLDVPLDSIKIIVTEKNQDQISKLLKIEEERIESLIAMYRKKVSCLKDLFIDQDGSILLYKIKTKNLNPEDYIYIKLTTNFREISNDIINSYDKLRNYISNNNLEITSAPFILYVDDEIDEESINIKVCIPVNKILKNDKNISYGRTNPDFVAYTIHKGTHVMIRNAYKELFKWAHENNYEIKTPIRETYLVSHRDTDNSQEYRTELSCIISKK